ncbi:MAG: 3'(2'),5'-bisphosphate nucleotidase CysQ [Deinococcaceae bacterium]
MDLSREKHFARDIALEAGKMVLGYQKSGFSTEEKSPGDFVTTADKAASELTLNAIAKHFPEDGVLSEEKADDQSRLGHRRVWIVDPIDGTREFVNGTNDYVFSLGLVIDHKPILGVIYAPATEDVYIGLVGEGVSLNGTPTGFSKRPLSEMRVGVSNTEYQHTLKDHRDVLSMHPSGSAAYKLAKIVSGESDAAFTIAPRSEWDLAGAAAMLHALGGHIGTRDGTPLFFNQRFPQLHRGTLAGRPDAYVYLHKRLIELGIPEKRLWVTPESDVWMWVPEHMRQVDRDHHVHMWVTPTGPQSVVQVQRTEKGWKIKTQVGSIPRFVHDLQREYGAWL